MAREDCLPDRPGPGEIVVAQVRCSQMSLPGGDSRSEDWWLANNLFRAVLRNPQASLTLVGVDGGTLIDAAPWGTPDGLHEVAPMIHGGWLDIDEIEVFEDGIAVSGTVVSLPDQLVPEGEHATVRWRIAPDDPWLHLEGSDGLWMHPAGGLAPLDGWFWDDGHTYGHDGVVAVDLGGAVRIDGASAVLIGTPAVALAERAGGNRVELSGTAPNAERLHLIRDDVVVGILPVDAEGAFEATIPADIEWVRTHAAARAYGVRVAPAAGLALQGGSLGSVEIRPAWPTTRRKSLRVDWVSLDGRDGVAHLPDTGGLLNLGYGAFGLTVSAGPSYGLATVEIEADNTSIETVVVQMSERFDPGEYALAALQWPTDRSRSWRGTDLWSARLAVGLGADFAVFAPPDDVADVDGAQTAFPRLTWENGSTTTAPDGSWSITAWPWDGIALRPGRGATDPGALDPDDALAAAVGALTRDRHTVVDIGWLDRAGAPFAIDPGPEGVRLDSPGAVGPAAWAPWFAWLDAGYPLTPVGPLAWFAVPNPETISSQDIAQAFTRGHAVATTGPLIRLEVAGTGPGEIAPDPVDPTLAEISVGGADGLEHVALIGEGGAILAQWDLAGAVTWQTTSVVSPGAWVVAVAWDDAGLAFAATGPVWLDPP